MYVNSLGLNWTWIFLMQSLCMSLTEMGIRTFQNKKQKTSLFVKVIIIFLPEQKKIVRKVVESLSHHNER